MIASRCQKRHNIKIIVDRVTVAGMLKQRCSPIWAGSAGLLQLLQQ